MEEYILIVDDDEDIRNMLGIYLENEGYKFIKCASAKEAMEIIGSYRISLVLLDVMMPGIDGIQACIKIRENKKMPVIFMSAKGGEMDIMHGLMAGGDDYVVKPFNPLQLMARVKAQLRRYKYYGGSTDPGLMLQHKDLVLDSGNRQVWSGGKEITLTSKEFDILRLLMQHKGNVLSVAQIYENVWHEEFLHSENTVMMHIANLRNKLRSPSEPDGKIKTVWGRGYRI